MKTNKLILGLTLGLILSSTLVQAATDSITCPTTTNNSDDMYQAMEANSVWLFNLYAKPGDAIYKKGIFFVDDNHLSGIALNQPTIEGGQALRNRSGVFKITYNHNAKECRRMIEVGDYIGNKTGRPGEFDGWMIVELCDSAAQASLKAAGQANPQTRGLDPVDIYVLAKARKAGVGPNLVDVERSLTQGQAQFFKLKLSSIRFKNAGSSRSPICQLATVTDPSAMPFANAAAIADHYNFFLTPNGYQGNAYYFDSNNNSTLIQNAIVNPIRKMVVQ